jgi:hypothetical protein
MPIRFDSFSDFFGTNPIYNFSDTKGIVSICFFNSIQFPQERRRPRITQIFPNFKSFRRFSSLFFVSWCLKK